MEIELNEKVATTKFITKLKLAKFEMVVDADNSVGGNIKGFAYGEDGSHEVIDVELRGSDWNIFWKNFTNGKILVQYLLDKMGVKSKVSEDIESEFLNKE